MQLVTSSPTVVTYTYDAENRIIKVDGGATAACIVQRGWIADRENSREHGRLRVTGRRRGSRGVWLGVFGSVLERGLRPFWWSSCGGIPECHNIFLSQRPFRFDPIADRVDKSVADSIDYLPFGEQIAGDTGSSHKFTGKERDSETGLDYFGARYNASTMGRFMTPDPMFMNDHHLFDPQELNLYSYVRNNPLSLTDPTELDLWLKCKGTANCHKGYVGTWDKDHKHFTQAIGGDLTDSATLDRRGVTVKYNGGTYQGVWDTNKGENNAAQVAGGAGALSGFTATINGNCSNTCVVSGFPEHQRQQCRVRASNVRFRCSRERISTKCGIRLFVFHKSDGSFDINFRGYLPDDPEGLPSTHIPCSESARSRCGLPRGRSVPIRGCCLSALLNALAALSKRHPIHRSAEGVHNERHPSLRPSCSRLSPRAPRVWAKRGARLPRGMCSNFGVRE